MPLFEVHFNKHYIALPIAIWLDAWKGPKRYFDLIIYIGPFSIEISRT